MAGLADKSCQATIAENSITIADMADLDLVPQNPLEFIRGCVLSGSVSWTYHVNMRLKGRYIPRAAVIGSVDSYEVVEEYPEDKYLPSYLVYSNFNGLIFHIVIAVDVVGRNVRMVTAYRPDLDKWKADLRTRKRN